MALLPKPPQTNTTTWLNNQVGHTRVSHGHPQPPSRVVLQGPTHEEPDDVAVAHDHLVAVLQLVGVGSVDETEGFMG